MSPEESATAHTHAHHASSAESETARATQWLGLEEMAAGSERIGGMLVRSAQIRKVFRTISRLGPYKATVLIQGESGTGKELIAQALHTLGAVPKGPFVTFNCSNLVESLAESQLFGHVKGAFTDARENSIGYFRSADGGTLFLDEVGELPLRLQPKLLRAVEAHEIQPVGSTQSYKVDIRLVAASNRDLGAMVRAGQFRADLYYRLNAATIHVAPLRERRDAIPAFAGHFIEHYNNLLGKDVRWLSRRALNALMASDWPGNVREFAHVIESAVMLTDGDRIDLHALPDFLLEPGVENESVAELIETVQPHAVELPDREPEQPLALTEVIKAASRDALVRALSRANGNCHRAADLLGVSRYTVYRMLARYGLTAGRGRRSVAHSNGAVRVLGRASEPAMR